MRIKFEKIKEFYERGDIKSREAIALLNIKFEKLFRTYSIFLDILKTEKNKNILDVGCGDGNLLKVAEDRGLLSFGVDISLSAIRTSQLITKKSKTILARGENLPFKEKFFDYITCLGSLEHFLDQKKALKELKRVSRDDAKFCIMVPNINFWGWRLEGKTGTGQVQEKLLDLNGWKKVIEKSGFSIVKTFKDKHPPKIFNTLSVIERILYEPLWYIVPLKLCPQFIFICKKSSDF